MLGLSVFCLFCRYAEAGRGRAARRRRRSAEAPESETPEGGEPQKPLGRLRCFAAVSPCRRARRSCLGRLCGGTDRSFGKLGSGAATLLKEARTRRNTGTKRRRTRRVYEGCDEHWQLNSSAHIFWQDQAEARADISRSSMWIMGDLSSSSVRQTGMKIGCRLYFWMLVLSPGRKGAELTEGNARLFALELHLSRATNRVSDLQGLSTGRWTKLKRKRSRHGRRRFVMLRQERTTVV